VAVFPVGGLEAMLRAVLAPFNELKTKYADEATERSCSLIKMRKIPYRCCGTNALAATIKQARKEKRVIATQLS
jgi:hypothetical protein